MQLDQTRIAIRERGFLEILDLALRVVRAHAGGLLAAWAVGAVPVIALNSLLLIPYIEGQFNPDDLPSAFFPALMLMIWETPLATAAMTLYLGEALFVARPQARRLWRSFLASLGQVIWYQVIVRGLLTVFIITWLFLYGSRPYANEVILLERNPMFGRHSGQMTTGRRIRRLHAGFGGEIVSRWVSGLLLGSVLLVSLAASWELLQNQFIRPIDPEVHTMVPAVTVVLWQIELWLVLGFFAVVRYLCYLDLRIRREGWEVELLVRAEEVRLKRRLESRLGELVATE